DTQTPDLNPGRKPGVRPQVARLTFPVKVYPPPENALTPPRPVEAEYKRPGWHDFWFVNDSGEDVKFGLKGMNCKCSSVQLYLLPADARQPHGPLAANEAARAVLGGGGALGLLNAYGVAGPAQALAKPTALEPGEETRVPAGATG